MASLALLRLCVRTFRLPLSPPPAPTRPASPTAAPPARARGAGTRACSQGPRRVLDGGLTPPAGPGGDGWRVTAWVNRGAPLGFRPGRLAECPPAGPLHSVEKHTLPPRRLGAKD